MRVGQGAEAQRNFAATALRLIGGRQPLLATVFYSAGVNVLALTGPAYMLLVYDSVLPSHAGAHLLWLTLLMLLLYGLSARWALAASLDPTSARACRSWLMLNARLRDAQDAAARPTIVSSASAIGNARARCPSCPDGRLPFCRDACGIDHADAGLGAFGDVNGPMALSGGGTGQRRTALCSALDIARACAGKAETARVVRYVGRIQIVLRSGDAYARRAMGASVRSTSGFRPTAE